MLLRDGPLVVADVFAELLARLLGSSRAMMNLHATVGFEDERLADFRVLCPDNRIECDLHIFRDAKVSALAVRHQFRTLEMSRDGEANDVVRRASSRCRLCIEAIT